MHSPEWFCTCMLMRKSHHKQFVSSHLEMMFCHHQTLQSSWERGTPSFFLYPLLSFSSSCFLFSRSSFSTLSFSFQTLSSLFPSFLSLFSSSWSLFCSSPYTVRDVLLVWGSMQHHILILLLRNLRQNSKQDFCPQVQGVFQFRKSQYYWHNCIVL